MDKSIIKSSKNEIFYSNKFGFTALRGIGGKKNNHSLSFLDFN